MQGLQDYHPWKACSIVKKPTEQDLDFLEGKRASQHESWFKNAVRYATWCMPKDELLPFEFKHVFLQYTLVRGHAISPGQVIEAG